MQTITLNIPNEQLSQKVLWFLNHLKDDGLEIITHQEQKPKDAKLQQLDEIINSKSKESIKVDNKSILHPHQELSHDIS